MSRHDSKQIENVKVMLLKGESGSSIAGIAKTGTDGLVDTYTITLTDGSKTTFTVTNGKAITGIAKTGTQGLVDTYTITFNDGTTSTFDVTNGANGANGVGISSIAKTDTTGLVDTYTITYTNGQTTTFTVTNGANGQDVANSNLANVERSASASQSYSIGQHLIYNGIYYKVIQAISQGETISIGVNISQSSISQEIENVSNYYTDEIACGVWTDGKTLYKKSFIATGFNKTNVNNSSIAYDLFENDASIGIPKSATVRNIIGAYGDVSSWRNFPTLQSSNSKLVFISPFFAPNSSAFPNIAQPQISFRTLDGSTGYNVYLNTVSLTVYYTK